MVNQTEIKFHENPSSASRDVPCGQTDGHTDRMTDLTKLPVAFRNFANVPKNESSLLHIQELKKIKSLKHMA
jgi:hypothetical protein